MNPPEVLVVLQDSVEPKMNSVFYKSLFLVSSSHLFPFFLPPQQWLLPDWGVLVLPM